MSSTKASVDFAPYPAARLAPVAQAIHDAMTANPNFGAPPVPMANLQAAIDSFTHTLSAKVTRATAATIAFNLARHELEDLLGQLGEYVNLTAKGDAALVNNSAFPAYSTARVAPDTAPPAAPADVVLRHGDLPGEVVARYHPMRPKSMNEVQATVGDPNLEAGWQHAGMFSGGKATVGGLTPGAATWLRVRTAGIKGVMGAWSDPARIIVV